MIEDERDVREILDYNLQQAGYEVHVAVDGESGLGELISFEPDLVLLDLMLPDMPGADICRRIRADRPTPPPAVIMLTAKGEEIDRVVGFELGADDYVVKPFSLRELLLRVGVLLRRAVPKASREQPAPRRIFQIGPLTVDIQGHHVYVEDAEIHVSSLEMRLLIYLVEHQGRVRSRNELLKDVWGYKPGVSTRTVDTHVKRLRDKLGAAGPMLETVRGTGYRLSERFAVVETSHVPE